MSYKDFIGHTVEQYIGPAKDPYMHSALVGCIGSRAVGIELELEHVTGYELPHSETQYTLLNSAPGWAVKRDNSLRNDGVEFISLPSGIDGIMEKLLLLFSQPKSKNWKTSARTGLHVHVNVRDFTWRDIRSLVVAYCLLEPAMFAWVGREREENIFCIPYYRTPKAVLNFHALQNNVSIQEGITSIANAWCKYTALHLAPVYKFGSVEFRHAPSWVEPYRIAAWARMCEKIVSYAKGKEPKDIINAWDTDWVGFLSQFTFIPNYFETVQKLDSDFLANVIAGIDVSPDAWGPNNSIVDKDWGTAPIAHKALPLNKLIFEETPIPPPSHPKIPKYWSNELGTLSTQGQQIKKKPKYIDSVGQYKALYDKQMSELQQLQKAVKPPKKGP